MDDDAFRDKVVVVTGSTSGMGAAIARRFAGLGARVVLNSSSSASVGRAMEAELEGSMYVQGDVGSETDCTRIADAALERWGRIDVLVNNAAIAPMIDHADMDALTDEIWIRTLSVNLLGPWHLTRAALPALRSAKGAVVNVSSLAGTRPTETASSIAYQLSKSALNHLTVLMANALGPDVQVNALAPGRIETPIWGDRREALLASAADRIALGRAGTPEEIADVCVFLARRGFVTGQVLVVDGGMGTMVPRSYRIG